MIRRFTATYDEPLRDHGFPTFEERMADTDPTHSLKGVFFDDLVNALGPDLATYTPQLIAPPRLGRYLPFQSYPLKDHALLAYHAARKLHPSLSMREGLRRLHRGNLVAFAKTTAGRVLTAMTSDIRVDYARIEEGFKLGRVCGSVEVRAIEARAIEVKFLKSDAWLDCSELGTLEGMSTFFDTRLRIEVEMTSTTEASLVCRFLND